MAMNSFIVIVAVIVVILIVVYEVIQKKNGKSSKGAPKKSPRPVTPAPTQNAQPMNPAPTQNAQPVNPAPTRQAPVNPAPSDGDTTKNAKWNEGAADALQHCVERYAAAVKAVRAANSTRSADQNGQLLIHKKDDTTYEIVAFYDHRDDAGVRAAVNGFTGFAGFRYTSGGFLLNVEDVPVGEGDSSWFTPIAVISAIQTAIGANLKVSGVQKNDAAALVKFTIPA